MALKLQLIKNVLATWGFYIANILISIILVPVFLNSVGDVYYGFWVYLNSVMVYLNLSNLGMGSAIIKYISFYKGKDDRENQIITFNSIFGFFFGVFVFIITTVLIMIVFQFPDFIFGHREILHLNWIVFLIGLKLAIAFPFSTYGGVLMAYQRHDLLNSLLGILTFLRGLFILIVLKLGFGLLGVASVVLLDAVLEGVGGVYFCRKVTGMKLLNPRKFSIRALKEMFSFSGYSFLLQFADKMKYQADYFIIGTFGLPVQVTAYSIPNRLIEYLRQIVLKAQMVLAPTISEMKAKEDQRAIRYITGISIKGSYFILLISGSILMLWGKDIIRLWVGAKYESTFSILFLLLMGQIMALPHNSLTSNLWGQGLVKIPALFNTTEGIVNFGLSIIFFYQIGILGVALATVVSQLLFQVIIMPVYYAKLHQYDVLSYYRENALYYLLFGLIYFVFFWFHFHEYGYMEKAGFQILLLAVIMAFYWYLERGFLQFLIRFKR